MLAQMLDKKIMVPARKRKQNLCLDAGYVGKEDVVAQHGYVAHIRPRGENKTDVAKKNKHKPRMWVVECFHYWINRFRKLVPGFEKTDLSYCALLHFADSLVVLNKIMIIYG